MSQFNPTFTLGGDLTVHRMGYGAMRITGEGIWGPPRDKAEAIRVLQTALEEGVDFIDTADSYGPYISEELIAEALYPYPQNLVIGTKGGLLRTGPNQWPVDGHPDHLKKALDGSLTRLKLDRIDLYQLHRVDPKVPFEKTLEFLQDVQEKGLVKHIGLSEVSIDDIKKAQQYIKVVSVQNKYSVDNRAWESVLDYCGTQNMAFIPWFPLNAGNVRSEEILKKIAGETGATVHQVALAWLLYHQPNILLIPGTSSVAHLKENLGASKVSLSDAQLKQLNDLGASTIG